MMVTLAPAILPLTSAFIGTIALLLLAVLAGDSRSERLQRRGRSRVDGAQLVENSQIRKLDNHLFYVDCEMIRNAGEPILKRQSESRQLSPC